MESLLSNLLCGCILVLTVNTIMSRHKSNQQKVVVFNRRLTCVDRMSGNTSSPLIDICAQSNPLSSNSAGSTFTAKDL